MGCSSSKENDQTVAGAVTAGDAYQQQAEDAAAMVNNGGPLYSRLLLSISCKGLVNLDRLSKSDPFVLVKLHNPLEAMAPVEIGRTEIISNTLSPQFVTQIPVTFRFEEQQNLRFEVYDVDTAYNSADATRIDPAKQEFQGFAECALAEIVGGRNQRWEGSLAGGVRGAGHVVPTIVVRAEEVVNSNSIVEIGFSSSGISTMTAKGKAFLRISRIGETGESIPCYKTETIQLGHGQTWKVIKLTMQVLANGDPYRPLHIELFGYRSSGNHLRFGSCKASVNDIQTKAPPQQGVLTLDDAAGDLVVSSCTLIPQHSFFDYLAGGMKINFKVGIDYTASNGDPRDPSSLHYHDPSGQTLNEYGEAIRSVGGILEYFDDDRRFPLYGFGGRPDMSGPAQHCFAVNGNEQYPEIDGIENLLATYRRSLYHVQLSGPTLFAPIVGQAAAVAASTKTKNPSRQSYTVLLIITDGVINDMDNTIESIVGAADYPFSIIIVGVGQADYAAMNALDGDEVRLRNRAGVMASRDIVQFVPMRNFKGRSSHALAKEVLEEIPGQVIQYMKANAIPPGDPHRAAAMVHQMSRGAQALQEGRGAYGSMNAPPTQTNMYGVASDQEGRGAYGAMNAPPTQYVNPITTGPY